jgi:putative transposase
MVSNELPAIALFSSQDPSSAPWIGRSAGDDKIKAAKAAVNERRRRIYFNIARRIGRSTLKNARVFATLGPVRYRGFASKLHHGVPNWVEPGALFHIRIRLDRTAQQPLLIDPALAQRILDSAHFYEMKERWHITIFLLMPDHLHALLSFARDQGISQVVGDWKHFHKHVNHIGWQEGFFDHRPRDDERGEQLSDKVNYIRRNPVAAGLCKKTENWPWIIVRAETAPHIERTVDRPLRRAMIK